MTRAQIAAARARIDRELDERVGPSLVHLPAPDRAALVGALVTAVLGHPDGRAPKIRRGPPWPRRAER